MSDLDGRPDVSAIRKRDEIEDGQTPGKEEEPKPKKVQIAHPNNLHGKKSIGDPNEVSETHQKPDPKTLFITLLNGLKEKDINCEISPFGKAAAERLKVEDILEDTEILEEYQQCLNFDLKEFLKTGKPDPKTLFIHLLNGLKEKDINGEIPSLWKATAETLKVEDILKRSKILEEYQQCLNFDLKEFLKTGKKRSFVASDAGLKIAVQDYKFEVPLTHDGDVKALKKRLEEVQQWHSNTKDRARYMAPLLPVIQSSGTGKSRVLFELRKVLNAEKKFCRSILLTNRRAPLVKSKLAQKSPGKKAYDEVIDVTSYDITSKIRDIVLRQCKECIGSKAVGKQVDVVLFFDEAQHLTKHDGRLFKVLRRVTREKHFPSHDAENEFKITVVLAGTTLSLVNFFPETQTSTGSSRYLDDTSNYYYTLGEVPYEPFYILRTQGCLSNRSTQGEGTEYQKMIRFSRPLFQVMKEAGKLDTNVEYDIALKIVLGEPDWTKNVRSCLSVLATRVQMGATSTSVVSDLVSKGYAHLTYFRNKDKDDSGIPSLASFAFLPDPVCARVAMCLMDEKFKFCWRKQPGISESPLPIKGTYKMSMARMMGTIFSSGLCLPAKGDFGEIAVALYLLFCGDILRAKKKDKYHSLSVGLSSWMDCVWNKGDKSQPTTNWKQWEGLEINCIQFFRYAFRSSLEELGDSTFLGSLYSKGCAIYCPINTEAIDLVIPCHDVKNDTYIPVFVSVKHYAQLSAEEAIDFLQTSYNALKGLKIDKGLLLLGIAGGQDRQKVSSVMYENEWRKKKQNTDEDILVTAEKPKDFHEKLCGGFFCTHDDKFDINIMLRRSSFAKAQQRAEVYSMHSELIHMEKSNLTTKVPRYNTSAKAFYLETLGMVQSKDKKDKTSES